MVFPYPGKVAIYSPFYYPFHIVFYHLTSDSGYLTVTFIENCIYYGRIIINVSEKGELD